MLIGTVKKIFRSRLPVKGVADCRRKIPQDDDSTSVFETAHAAGAGGWRI
jgi:hypothetical protein